MVRKMKAFVVAGALMAFAAPAMAQDVGGAINGIAAAPGQLLGGMGQGLGIDLDPFHIFTPAPQPMAAPGEAMAPRRGMRRNRRMSRRLPPNGARYHHKQMMMHKKKMMRQKRMMKSEKMMMKKDMMKK